MAIALPATNLKINQLSLTEFLILPEIKPDSHQGRDILPMLEVFSDWKLSVDDVFNLLTLTKS
ncbi:MAG: hypothetical protein ACOYN8_04210 [Pseudanabaena sp.]|jgi:hypothetical protein